MNGSDQRTIDQTAATIRAQNDAFRKNLSGGRILISTAAMDHMRGKIAGLILAIANFDTFNEDNDPYGEHDFGSLSYMGQPMFWKIDYYDLDMIYGSPDPANPDVTTRTLVVMLAWEY